MNRLLHILAYILVGVFALLLVTVVALLVVQRRPYPQTDGAQTVAGLKAEVTVYRDDYGIPHIYASSLEDLLFAQGYVHAQDRFWQMEWWRHIGQGRISEIAGEATLGNDKFIRTMGWNRMAQTTIEYYRENEPAYYALLEAYAAGVNAYIGDKSPGELSLNYTVLQAVNEPWEIEPWEPIDTVAWGVVMSFDLANDIDRELAYARMIDQFGEEVVAELVPGYPYYNRPVIAPTDQLVSEIAKSGVPAGWATAVNWQNVNTSLIGAAPQTLGGDFFVGSNNWVISGQHTDTGQPLLANDPHLSIQMPAIWYQVGLHAPGYDVVGFSFAGVPGVIIGHNNDIAWGVTNTGADVQDLYIERITGNQYEYMGEMHDLEIIEETIKVNGGDDVVLPVRITRHGPIISDVLDDAADVLAVRWVAQEPSRVLQAVLLLNQASNYQEFRDALRYWDVPSQNVVYADREGNIAYQMPGYTPIRRSGIGMVPSPGWTDEYEWEGWIPFEELPALFNPDQGYISTANHAIVDRAYPHYITRDWADGDRGQRIVEMIDAIIAGGGKISMDDIAAIQNDNFSLLAKTYVPYLANLQPTDPQVQAAISTLRSWDGQEVRDSSAATIFELFYVHLYPAILADELGEENVGEVRNNIFLHTIAPDVTSPWWDNVNTPQTETREDILLQALTETLAWLDENEGGNVEWGQLHTATFVSSPLGDSGIADIEALVNRGPFAADGGRSIVNATGWSPDNPAVITGHPSMRMILDLSDFDASRAVIPTGQSGHPGHPLYDSEIELWLNGEYHPLWWSREAVEANAVDEMVLRP
ncbi:MAG TPA: penicillin acylase family protein [Chloroflexota bacterium]|nr:penicillin acylase family protein [Chloroflexota bacterium]